MLYRGASAVPRSCAVAIVGAGMAGLELASELDRRGIEDIVVFEAGPVADPRHVNMVQPPDAAARTWLKPGTDSAFHRPWESLTPPHYTGSAGIRRRLGGRSLYWAGVILPIESWALSSWPDDLARDLCVEWQGGASLYARVNAQLDSWHTEGTGCAPHGEDRREVTVAGTTLHTTPVAVRRSAANPDRWFAYSPLDAWRDPETGTVKRQPNCTLTTGVEVLHVLTRHGDCRGVLVRDTATGRMDTVDTSLVVLAAGTLENTRLVTQVLAECGALEKPRLSGLTDHQVQGFFVRLEGASADALLTHIPPGNYYAPCAVRANLYVEVVGSPAGSALLDVRLSGEQCQAEDSYVECVPQLSYPWRYRVHTGVGDADREVLDAQRQALQDIWHDVAPRLGPVERRLDFEDFSSASRTNAFVLPEHLGGVPAGTPVTWASHLGTEDHEGGTLPLGGLLTTRHECLDVPGLFAAGPATFPRAGAANPVLTTLALAHRLAVPIAARL